MKNNKRTFIAIKIPPQKALKDTIQALKYKFEKSKIKWVNTEDFHLTLHFLGETSPEQIEKINEILNCTALQNAPFEIELKELGAFYKNRQPLVIWVGIAENKKLTNLFSRLRESLSENGFILEDRPFSPHLTLGRVKQIEDFDMLKSMLIHYKNVLFQKADIKEVYFYESILLPSGPVYKPINIVKLSQ